MKIGLKTFVTNLDYIPETNDLYSAEVFDYIEIYLVAGVSRDNISEWIETGIPLNFHAPHSYGGFNTSLAEKAKENQQIMLEIYDVCSMYTPDYLVFHPGIQGNLGETIRQFNILFDQYPQLRKFSLIENKPMFGMKGELCLGATPDDIKLICKNTGLSFCLDFGHAISASASLNLDWKEYINCFLEILPKAFHLSDGHLNSQIDEHLHFTYGDFDIPWCLSKIKTESFVTLETEKESKDSLDDFLKDVRYIQDILKSS